MRKARAQSTVQMLVDEERPEKTRCAQPSQYVPGRGERQENCRARKQAQLAPSMQSTRHRNECDNGAGREKQADQRAGQDRGSAKGGGAPISQSRVEASGPRTQINRKSLQTPACKSLPGSCSG